jgi:hypothetical protein
MGVPTSEVGYTWAIGGRGDSESIRDMWWQKKKSKSSWYIESTNVKKLLSIH